MKEKDTTSFLIFAYASGRKIKRRRTCISDTCSSVNPREQGTRTEALGAHKDHAVCRHISFPWDSYGGGGLLPCHFMSREHHNEC